MSISITTGELVERKLTVWAEDVVTLTVREYGPTNVPVTVVLQGHCLAPTARAGQSQHRRLPGQRWSYRTSSTPPRTWTSNWW